jgi:hypothetical protein
MLVGCAETQRLMAKVPEAESFLARAATAYGQPAPILRVESTTNGWVAFTREGVIYLDMRTLGVEDWKLKTVLAHEYAHVLLHNYGNGGSADIENETDAKGIEVLMKADNLTERQAFRIFYWYAGGGRVLRGELPVQSMSAKGHGLYCDRINFLLARYPAQAEWAKPCGYKPVVAEQAVSPR